MRARRRVDRRRRLLPLPCCRSGRLCELLRAELRRRRPAAVLADSDCGVWGGDGAGASGRGGGGGAERCSSTQRAGGGAYAHAVGLQHGHHLARLPRPPHQSLRPHLRRAEPPPRLQPRRPPLPARSRARHRALRPRRRDQPVGPRPLSPRRGPPRLGARPRRGRDRHCGIRGAAGALLAVRSAGASRAALRLSSRGHSASRECLSSIWWAGPFGWAVGWSAADVGGSRRCCGSFIRRLPLLALWRHGGPGPLASCYYRPRWEARRSSAYLGSYKQAAATGWTWNAHRNNLRSKRRLGQGRKGH
mmetsp:Transcript_30578/g.63957  ORF Transcript_30578/g.63957 Transcript_30578/m.63957 type:complete len:304 (+) Transcript_30578:242-1153(+)